MAKWVDLEMTDEEKLDALMPIPMTRPDYPCGLKISFDKTTIAKLGLEELPAVGDILDMRCFMEVTHIDDDGPAGCCFEAQITMILSPVENETTEMPEASEDEPRLETHKPLMDGAQSRARPARRQVLYRKPAGASWDENLA